VHGSLFCDSAGKPLRMISTSLDITARKETEDARRQSEAKLKRLQDSNIIGIMTANSSHIVEANQVFLDMIGYTEADLREARIGWRNITPPEHWPASESAIVQLMTAGACEPLEKEYIRKDGTRVPVLVGAAAYRRDPLGWVCFVLDLTGRKRAEKALRESEEWRAAALRAGKLGVYDYNPQSGRLKWDRETYRLWGVPEGEEVTYETFLAGVHPDDLNAVSASVERALGPAGTHRHECEYRVVNRADGSVRWISADGDVTFEDGQPVRLVGTVQDVTERKRAQERIHLLMREVNHRSKNMLSIVQAIARQTIASGPEDFLERFGDRIEALAASQDLLVKNAWKGVALADLVRSQLALFEDLIGARIEFSGPPLLICASAAQTLGMALHELATNAGKYGALSNCRGRYSATIWVRTARQSG
jgi:PAS domain S-box-containing protein